MAQRIVIVLGFPEERAEAFEVLFRAEILPLRTEFGAAGKLLSAVLARVIEGSDMPKGVQEYVVDVEVPSEEEH